ncbi:MAG: succinate dehydrogenase, hydrophobic membrane anchor protein [Sulfuricellaceae bacterium]|jgi:succinate dehydrogenase / fumarate reductase membrane anchor subunit
MVKRNVVGAGYGLRDWLMQRITAVVMAAYSLVFAFLLLTRPVHDFAAWRALFAPEWMKLASLLFALSLMLHAWVGVRDILMDYVKPAGLRLSLQSATILVLVSYAAWTVQILWSL